MNKQAVAEFNNFKKKKIDINVVPRAGDYIIQLFVTRKKLKGGLVLNDNLLDGVSRTETTQPYPFAIVVEAGEDTTYEKGDVVYLTDNILLTKDNPDWVAWREKFENQKPTPHEAEPPRYKGGINELAQFRFKMNKFQIESDRDDEYLFQVPQRVVRGIVK
jgi:signal peptidase I